MINNKGAKLRPQLQDISQAYASAEVDGGMEHWGLVRDFLARFPVLANLYPSTVMKLAISTGGTTSSIYMAGTWVIDILAWQSDWASMLSPSFPTRKEQPSLLMSTTSSSLVFPV